MSDSSPKRKIGYLQASPWTKVIRPRKELWDLQLKELWRYRELVFLFVRRDFVARYKQTILGPLWYILPPIFNTGMYTVIFGMIASLPTDGIPPFLFYMSGTILWNFFSAALTNTSSTFIVNAGIFGKVYFPRLAAPIADLFSLLITFAIQFGIFISFLLYFYVTGSTIRPNFHILWTPLLLLLMAGLGLGFGIIVAALTTRYRDLMNLLGFGTSLLMYATPIIYPLSMIPEKLKWLFLLNPITPVIESFRYAFLGAGDIKMIYLLYTSLFTCIVLAVGMALFNKVQSTFMDTV